MRILQFLLLCAVGGVALAKPMTINDLVPKNYSIMAEKKVGLTKTTSMNVDESKTWQENLLAWNPDKYEVLINPDDRNVKIKLRQVSPFVAEGILPLTPVLAPKSEVATPVRSVWKIRQGGLLKQELAEWAQQANWQYTWDFAGGAQNFEVGANFEVTATAEEALVALKRALPREAGIEICLNLGNKLLLITNGGKKCPE